MLEKRKEQKSQVQSVGDPIELGGEAANQDENQVSDPKIGEKNIYYRRQARMMTL